MTESNDHKTIEQRLSRLEHAAITQQVPVSDEELASTFADAIEASHTRNPASPDGQHIISGIRAVRAAIENAKENDAEPDDRKIYIGFKGKQKDKSCE